MSSSFARWFRALSNGQAFMVYGFLVLFALLTLWHNPTDGYRRTLTAIRTASAEEARSGMQMFPDENDWEEYKDRLKWYGVPEGGHFYLKKNPWWWVYAYESKGFREDAIPRFVRPHLLSLDTLGGYMHTVGIIGISTFLFICLMGIRKSHPE